MVLPRRLREAAWRPAHRVGAWAHSIIEVFWCSTQGIRWQRGWQLRGRPLFRVVGPGARILIGKRFSAHSTSAGNSIGVFQPVILTSWGADARLEIGDDVGMSGCSVTAVELIRIGDRVMIGAGALIMDTDAHPLDAEARFHGLPALSAPVTIEDDAFIGSRAIILKGTSVGRCAVVGAGAVVTKDVPAYAIVAGNPARVVGEVPRFGAANAQVSPAGTRSQFEPS